jgi:hypothetical protein
MQLNKLLSHTIPTITPSQLCAKVRVCNVIIDVCTSMLNPLLCRFDAYCNKPIAGVFIGHLTRLFGCNYLSNIVDLSTGCIKKYQHQIYAVFYNRGCQHQINLFNKAYRHLYKKSFVKISNHLFIRVLIRISVLEMLQIPCCICVSFRSNFIIQCAIADRYEYDVLRREYRTGFSR